ncbi:hypothetical protein [Haloglomus litoreum]|uniref:hypothetical protein n=1 Tax=Haloglomus litoreum TaxID=3034026 RepID=UPI0023E79444|nr:hypothetical protein [Haloglomus sp. DT116]
MADTVTLAGGGLTLLSTAGYAVATVAPYPGRAITLPGMMVGLTLLAVGLAADHDITATASEAAAAAETASEAAAAAETASEPSEGNDGAEAR